MMEYINTHQAGFWIGLGFILLATEVLVLGFGSIVLMFAGIGAVITGLAMNMGILPETWTAGISCFGMTTGVVTALLWKPFKKMQENSAPPEKQSSDLIGYQFVIQTEVTLASPGQHRYSGVDWKVELEAEAGDKIDAGKKVEVTSLDAGVFRVKSVA